MRNPGNLFDAIARYSMFALCAFLPFFFVPLAYVTVPQSKMMLSAILLIVACASWLIGRVMAGSARIPQSSIVVCAALLPLAYAISAAVTGFHAFSLLGVGVEQDTLAASLLLFSALVLAACIFTEEPGSAEKAMRAFSIGALILIVIQIVHLVVPALPLSPILVGQTANVFGNWHELALIVGLCAYLGLALFYSTEHQYWRFTFLALSILSFLFLVIFDFTDIWIALASLAFV